MKAEKPRVTFFPPLKQKPELKTQSCDLLTFTVKTFLGFWGNCLTIFSFTVRNFTIPRVMKTEGIYQVISYPNDNWIISIQGSQFFHFSILFVKPHPFPQMCQNLIPSIWAAPRKQKKKKKVVNISLCKSWLRRKHYPFEHSFLSYQKLNEKCLWDISFAQYSYRELSDSSNPVTDRPIFSERSHYLPSIWSQPTSYASITAHTTNTLRHRRPCL